MREWPLSEGRHTKPSWRSNPSRKRMMGSRRGSRSKGTRGWNENRHADVVLTMKSTQRRKWRQNVSAVRISMAGRVPQRAVLQRLQKTRVLKIYRIQEFKKSKISRIQDFQQFKNSRIEKFHGDRAAGAQPSPSRAPAQAASPPPHSRISRIQEFQDLQEFKNSRISRIQEFQEFKNSRIQENMIFKNSRIQEWQIFKKSRIQEFKNC